MIRVVVEENTRRLGSVFVSDGAEPLIYSRDEIALVNALAKAYLALLGKEEDEKRPTANVEPC